jgi:hypothetical protein
MNKNVYLKIKSKIIIELFLLIISTIVFLFLNKNDLLLGQIIFVISVVSNIQLMIKYKNNDILLIFLFFSFVHIIYIVAYYFFEISYHYLTDNQSLYNTNSVFFIQILVLRLIFIGIDSNKFESRKFCLPIKNNNLAYWISILILVILIPLSNWGLTPLSVNSGGYSIETESSIWSEYCIIFIIIAALHSNSLNKKRILIFISFFFMLMPLLYGKRLATIMVGLTVFNLFYSGYFSPRKIIYFFLTSFIVTTLFDAVRMYGFSSQINFVYMMLGVNDVSGALSNGPGGVLVSCVTYFNLIQTGVFDLEFSIKSFIGMFTSIFLPASLNLPETYINLEALKYDEIPGNGGFPGVYFYLWGRYLGVFIGSLLINFLFRNIHRSKYISIYVLFMLSTFPRWYTYNVHILVKMGFWLLFFVFLSGYFKRNNFSKQT